jgi:adenine-specific DNA-methyltransferase
MQPHDLGISGEDAKSLGAFYTDNQVAEFLVWWGIRTGADTVLDPSFGGGVFLRAAAKHLTAFGGNPAAQLFGVEVDAAVHERITSLLTDEFGIARRNLALDDFFTHEASSRLVSVIVGNPPFIRYQRFTGDARDRALHRAAQQGIRLSRLASSWLPFLLHSITHLKPGGRLAMVIPFELTHAAYAQPALQHLHDMFATVTFLTFRQKLFPHLSEDTLLLLAEGKDKGPARFVWRDLAHAGKLADLQHDALPLRRTKPLNTRRLAAGEERLIEYLIPTKVRDLYHELATTPATTTLGQIADVGIGYVTGANEYFHLSPAAVATWHIPTHYLRPALRRGRSLNAVRFTEDDLNNAINSGDAAYLLYIKPGDHLTQSVQQYLRQGEHAGIPKAYKCRVRDPWYCVPHVHDADAFLSYMSGATPRLVANGTTAVAPNSLHILRLHQETRTSNNAVAGLWQTSLTRLSCELEGHALGGGMLKLEPTEAQRVILPTPLRTNGDELATELDTIARTRGDDAARRYADTVVLRRGIGLTIQECALLREAATALHERRYQRSADS